MPDMQRPIATIFHRFGPYHYARLRALSAQVPTVSIEVVRKDATYSWDVVDDQRGLKRVTLFPELTGREPRIRELKQRLFDCLEAQQPSAVAIPGWQAPYALLALWWCMRTSTPAVLMSESTAGASRAHSLAKRSSAGFSDCTRRLWSEDGRIWSICTCSASPKGR